jgi:hypothetical protein
MALRSRIKRRLLQLLSVPTTILFTFTAVATAIFLTILAVMPGARARGFSYTVFVLRDAQGELTVGHRGTPTLARVRLDGSWREDGLWAPTIFDTVTDLTVTPLPPNDLSPQETENIRYKAQSYFEANFTESQFGLDAPRRAAFIRRTGAYREVLYSGYLWNAAALLTGAAVACCIPLTLLRSFELAFHRQVRTWKETGQCTCCGYTLGADLAICPECGNKPSPL